MKTTKYESYKPTETKWIEKIPSHWEIKQLRHICTCEDGKRIPLNSEERSAKQGEYPYWGANSIVDYVDEWLFDEELVLLGEDGSPFLEANKTVSFLSKGKIWPNNHIHVLRPKEPGTGAFIAKALNAVDYSNFITGSTRDKLNQAAMNGIRIPWPSVQEKIAIAKFLDSETGKIDDLITKQERLIELLQEKRQAVISHAVTKGLNPSAPMKDSGVECLGRVPEHWSCKKIKHIARMESGHTPDRKVEAYWVNCEIPWVSLNDTGFLKDNDYITDTAYFINELGIQNSSARLLPERVVVFSRDATIGRCAITTRPMAVSQHFIAWVCGEEVSPEYLLLRLKSMTQELERLTFGATLKTIGMPDVKTLVTPVPPKDEQEKIVEHVKTRLIAIDELIDKNKKAVELHRERRSALISAAVTGQIDVRNLSSEEATS